MTFSNEMQTADSISTIGKPKYSANPLKAWWLPGLFLLACLSTAYWSIIDILAKQLVYNQNYSHGPVILPIVAYLIWQKREQLKIAGYAPDWRALFLLVFAAFIYAIGELGADVFTTRVSMLVFVVGFVWLLYGLQVVRILRFPLGFMFLMLPLPDIVYRNATFPLQLTASQWSVEILQNLGITAYREGNVIDLDFMMLQVVEACSGLRYILPLFSLGILFSYFLQKVIWKRVVLVLATIPIAVFANVFRITGTGILAMYLGEESARGFFHDFSGWLVFVFCLGLFALVNWMLKFIPNGRVKLHEAVAGPTRQHHTTGWSGKWTLTSVAAVVVLASPALVGSLGSVPPVPLVKALDEFPLSFDGYTGTRETMEPNMWEKVGAQEYIIINYEQASLPPVNFYVAYYEYQRKAGDFVHSPRLCLPGAGWVIEKNRVRNLEPIQDTPNGSSPLKLNEMVVSKGGIRQLVYFWYQGRGRNFTNEYMAKLYMVLDGLFRRRTDGALVRVVMPMNKDQSVEDARSITDAFALAASAELKQYLP